MDPALIDRWISEYLRCWKTKDSEAVTKLFTDEATYRASPFREPLIGRKAIREYWEKATKTQIGIQLQSGIPVHEGNRASVEWWATWTEDEKPVTLPGCLMLKFTENGICEELREYWHSEKRRRQPPQGWGR